MPLRCSPLTLYMLVGKCQMAFVWQVQQFWCLWDDLPWPYTCLLGRVASDWQWLCVAGAIFSMPPRSTLWPNVWRHWWPYLLFVWQVQYSRWLREVPGVYVLLVWQVQYFIETSEKVTVTLREVPRDTSSVLWQVPSLPPSSSAWPYTFSLCGRRNIFRCFRTFFARPGPKGRLWPHLLFVWQVQIIGDNGDPTFFLCGRCNIFDASGKFLVTLFLFCVAGALVTRPPRSTLWPHVLFVWQVLYVRCLREVLVTWTQGSLVTPPLFLCGRPPRSSADTAKGWLWPYTSFLCGMCNNHAAFWPYTHRLGRVTSDLFVALAIPKHLPWPDLHSDRLWPYRPICHPRHGFCVAGATISMPLRCCPLTLYMLVGKGRKWLTMTLCGRRNIFNASEKYFVTQCLATLVTLCLATLVTLLAFCVAGAVFSMAPRSSWCIRSACVAGAIF